VSSSSKPSAQMSSPKSLSAVSSADASSLTSFAGDLVLVAATFPAPVEEVDAPLLPRVLLPLLLLPQSTAQPPKSKISVMGSRLDERTVSDIQPEGTR
jgi:hypothetical protein